MNTSEWRWIYNNKVIPLSKNKFGFPPWANSVIDTDARPDESACLNLDRIDHTQPHFYGLNCDSKQAFACTTSKLDYSIKITTSLSVDLNKTK